jgi:hypothetical protein
MPGQLNLGKHFLVQLCVTPEYLSSQGKVIQMSFQFHALEVEMSGVWLISKMISKHLSYCLSASL